MKNFIVHFGAHKTGSTAFQRFVQNNRDALTARGLFIPKVEPFRDGNYSGLAVTMAGGYADYPKRVKRFMNTLDPVKGSEFSGDVLISAEYLSTGNFFP